MVILPHRIGHAANRLPPTGLGLGQRRHFRGNFGPGELAGNTRVRVDCEPPRNHARQLAGIAESIMFEDRSLHQSVPLEVDQALQQAVTSHRAGQLRDAERLYRAILEIQPGHPDANHNLGVLAVQANQPADSLLHFKVALEAKPDQGQYLLSYVDALLRTGQVDFARRVLEQGEQRGLQGREMQSAAALCAEVGPGTQEKEELRTLFETRRYADAAVLALAMTARYPVSRFAWKALGAALQRMGRNGEALAPMQNAALISPDDAEVYSNLGTIFQSLGQHDQAEGCCRWALRIAPDYADAHYNLANAQKDLGRNVEAEACCRMALALKPDHAAANLGLGNIAKELGRLEEAEACCRRAVEIMPDYAPPHLTLGNIAKDTGRLDEALANYRRALKLEPSCAESQSNLLFLVAYCGLVSQGDYLKEAQGWETLAVSKAISDSSRLRKFVVAPRKQRRLRIGYISGDFRQHPVSCYIESIFRHHDRSRAEVFAYSNNAIRDTISERLEKLVDHWQPIVGINDDLVCRRIEAAKIDVLIDLSGHTAFNRLSVFARRAAPIQAHYLGYFASTGLTEMDYWIGDAILSPEAEDEHFCETVWRLPRVWVSYLGRDDAPISRWSPDRDGTLWLGSFNSLNKITAETVALWARVLHALPEARLLLKTKELAAACNRQRMASAFAAYGIAQERLELLGSTPGWTSHMALYDRLDVALDPVGGVGGGTTTCDALWMGLPVVTFAGRSVAQRMTASMLHAVGHSEWIATSDSDYLAKVAAVARDVPYRSALRFDQREKVRRSALCDGAGLARSLEDAYERMFDAWWQKNMAT